MALATAEPRPIVVRASPQANRWEVTRLTIDTPPGTTTATIDGQALYVDGDGARSSLVPFGPTVLAGDALTAVMADACRRVLLAAGLSPEAVAAVDAATLGALLYTGIRDAVYAAKQADGTIPSDAA